MKSIIHVNQHKIKHNRTTGERLPVLTVKTYKDNRYASTLILRDRRGLEVARVVYRPDKPLPCGAVCWVETLMEVEVDGQLQRASGTDKSSRQSGRKR